MHLSMIVQILVLLFSVLVDAGGFGGIAYALHVESPSKQLQLYGSEASE